MVSELQTVSMGQDPPQSRLPKAGSRRNLGFEDRKHSPFFLLWAQGGWAERSHGIAYVMKEGESWLAVAMAFSTAVWPWASLQARKTYQVYHTESMNAEAKLREAERQEEKRAGRSGAAATAAAATATTATTTATTTEAGPLRKTSLKKGSRLVEKVGLEGICLFRKALAPGLCPYSPWPSRGPAGKWRMEGEGRAEDRKATDLRQGSKGRACAWSALLALEAPQVAVVDGEVRRMVTVSPVLLAAPTAAQLGQKVLWCSQACGPFYPPSLPHIGL